MTNDKIQNIFRRVQLNTCSAANNRENQAKTWRIVLFVIMNIPSHTNGPLLGNHTNSKEVKKYHSKTYLTNQCDLNIISYEISSFRFRFAITMNTSLCKSTKCQCMSYCKCCIYIPRLNNQSN